MPLLSWPDVVLLQLALSIAVGWAIVFSFLAAARFVPELRRGIAFAAVLGLAAVPVIVSPGYPGARALAVFLSIDAIFRVIDVTRRSQVPSTEAARFWSDLRFFVPFPVLLVTGEEWTAARRITSPIGTAAGRTAIGLILFLAAWTILFALQDSAVLRSSFVLDHIVKTVLFAATLEIIGLLASGLERFAGFETAPLMRRILTSRTPAEFWWRYNTRVHAWLVRNVFRPVGGAYHPVRGIVLVFFVSAIFHEAAFDIALGRVDGYQFAFFMLQIPAVLLSPVLERFATHGIPASVATHAVTIAWFLATSVLFFRGVAEIFPFLYTAPMPGPVFGEWRF